MELKLKTDVGDLTAVFLKDWAGSDLVYVGWIKEYPGVVVQTDTIEEAMKEMPGILYDIIKIEAEYFINNKD